MSTPSRVSKGQPTGGQFAASARTEAEVSLADPAAEGSELVELRRAWDEAVARWNASTARKRAAGQALRADPTSAEKKAEYDAAMAERKQVHAEYHQAMYAHHDALATASWEGRMAYRETYPTEAR